MDIELRHLRSFVAVAEDLNFTKAAKRLFIAQQALSTQIRQLEDRIGAQLLVRTTRSVSLTPAGEVLLSQARLLLSDAETAVAAARAAAAPRTALTVGFVAAVVHHQVSHAIDRFVDHHADVDVLIRFGDLLDPSGGLVERDADVAFVYGPFDTRGLELSLLYAEPMGVAVAATHPLAQQETVTISDVVAAPTFDFPAKDVAWRDFWSAAAFRDGVRPRFAARFQTLEGLTTSVRAGLGVHLATEGLAASAGDGVVWRELPDLPPLEHFVARRSDDDRPVVRAFVEAAVDVFRQ